MFEWIQNFEKKYFSGWKGTIFMLIVVTAFYSVCDDIDRYFIKGTRLEVWKDNVSLLFFWFIVFSFFWAMLYMLLGEKYNSAKFWKVGFCLYGGLLLIPASTYFLHGVPLNGWITLVNMIFLSIAFIFIVCGTYNKFIGSRDGDINYFDVSLLVLCGLLLVPVYLLMLWGLSINGFSVKS